MNILEFLRSHYSAVSGNKTTHFWAFGVALFLLLLMTQYFISKSVVKNNSPEIVAVDLVSLNGSFVKKVAGYLSESDIPQNEINKITAQYLLDLEELLEGIDQENYILIQRQMIISGNIRDITPDIEKMLFEKIITNLNKKLK